MIGRLLVAVDDSPAALAAARLAIGFAADAGAELFAVHVVEDRGPDASAGRAAAEWRRASAAERLRASGDAVLRHVEALARQEGVPVRLLLREGEPARHILAEARAWSADLILLGRSDRRGPGEPYIGPESRHVLELTDRPVVVVPAPAG